MSSEFEQCVRKAFDEQVRLHGGGARMTVYQHGQLLADVWGGVKDRKGTPVTMDTLFYCASCTKGVANICVAMLVDEGLVDYHERVAYYWPDFGQNHKESITVSQLLMHRAGLPHFEEMVEFPKQTLLEPGGNGWDEWLRFLAKQPARYQDQQAYHAVSVGFYVSALCWKVTGKTIGQFFNERVRVPFRVDYYMGQQVNDERLARVLQAKEEDEERKKPTRVAAQAYMLMSGMSSFFQLRNVESPSHIGWGNGRSLAWLFQLAVQGRLFAPVVMKQLMEVEVENAHDLVLDEPVSWTTGGFSPFADIVRGRKAVWGHSGMGGQMVFCDVELGLSVAFTTNAFLNDPRPRQRALANAVYDALKHLNPSAKL